MIDINNINGKRLIDIYSPKSAFPVDKAKLVGDFISLKPILPTDFNGRDGAVTIVACTDKKKASRAAVAFIVIGVGPLVRNMNILPGCIVIVSETSLDFADTKGTHLVCQEADVALVWDIEDLLEDIPPVKEKMELGLKATTKALDLSKFQQSHFAK